MDVVCESGSMHVTTLYDVLDKMCRVPERPISAPMRMPISGIYKIKGVGDVLAGRVEQGQVKPGEEVVFLPTHTASNPCTGKVFTVEMHHSRVDFANPGDNVGLNIKGLDKNNMPRSGDVMVYKKDTTLGQTREFDAQIQVLDIPNEIKVGYSPIGFVRCGRSACRISKLKWKMGKETGGKKMEDPHSLKSNEMAQCSFQPQQPLVCDTFKNCEGVSRSWTATVWSCWERLSLASGKRRAPRAARKSDRGQLFVAHRALIRFRRSIALGPMYSAVIAFSASGPTACLRASSLRELCDEDAQFCIAASGRG